MTAPAFKAPRTIAERGWLGSVIDDHLRPALKDAESLLSDLENITICDHPRCGLMFDLRDPRHGKFNIGTTAHHYCPACEIEAQLSTDPSADTTASLSTSSLNPSSLNQSDQS